MALTVLYVPSSLSSGGAQTDMPTQVSGLEFRVSGFGLRVLCFRVRFRVWRFGFQDSGLEFGVSGFSFGFRVSGFRVPDRHADVSGVQVRICAIY